MAGLASFSCKGMTSHEENEIGPATEKGMPALSFTLRIASESR